MLQAFFQSNRQTPATLGNQASSVQAMLMMVSAPRQRRPGVAAMGEARVATLIESGKSDGEILEELFLASVARKPTDGEIKASQHLLAKDRKTGFEDIQWALLNSPEFLLRTNRIDVMLNRRELLNLSGLALAGTIVEQTMNPLKVRAAGKANPRGSARNCIYIALNGAISQADCWDFKQTRYTPTDFDMQQLTPELESLENAFFRTTPIGVRRVSLVRSMKASELVHFTGQYHLQTYSAP